MKPRIKIDVLMMLVGVLVVIFLFQFPSLYPSNRLLDDGLGFVGVLLILKGIFLRMVARGHKKRLSKQSQDLVTSGPYRVVRNPMYLGTYWIGAGFFLALSPWWAVVLYSLVFYRRFRRQIIQEEKFLKKNFGKEYDEYCHKVPRLFPNRMALRLKMREAFPFKDAWTTKEKRAILPALIGVILLESLKETLVFGATDVAITLLVVLTAAGVFSLGVWIRYQEK